MPIEQANVCRMGSDVSVIGYGAQVLDALEVAKKLAEEDGVDIEVVDLRTIYPFDRTTVLSSMAKTGCTVIVHEAPPPLDPARRSLRRFMRSCSPTSKPRSNASVRH